MKFFSYLTKGFFKNYFNGKKETKKKLNDSFWRYNVTGLDTIGLILYYTDIISFHIGKGTIIFQLSHKTLLIK